MSQTVFPWGCCKCLLFAKIRVIRGLFCGFRVQHSKFTIPNCSPLGKRKKNGERAHLGQCCSLKWHGRPGHVGFLHRRDADATFSLQSEQYCPSWVLFPASCRGTMVRQDAELCTLEARAPWKRIALRLLARQRRSINLRTPAARRPHRAPNPPPPADQGRAVGNTSRALCPGTPHGAAPSGWVR